MKTMFFKVRGLLAFLVVMLLISDLSFAQQATSTGPGKFQTAKDVSMPVGADDPTLIKKTENGAALNTATGDITVFTANEKGETVQTVYAKPTANTGVDFEIAMKQFVTSFEAWMQNNPSYKQFLTAEQNASVERGDIESIFKFEYVNGQNAQSKKLTK